MVKMMKSVLVALLATVCSSVPQGYRIPAPTTFARGFSGAASGGSYSTSSGEFISGGSGHRGTSGDYGLSVGLRSSSEGGRGDFSEYKSESDSSERYDSGGEYSGSPPIYRGLSGGFGRSSSGGQGGSAGAYGGYQGGGPVVPILVDTREGPTDGYYKFEFETGDGIKRQEEGSPRGPYGAVVQQGSWSFTFPDGTPAEFSFVADDNGYVPDSPLLPKPHPLPAHAIHQIEKAERERVAGIIHDGSYSSGSGGQQEYPARQQGPQGRYQESQRQEEYQVGKQSFQEDQQNFDGGESSQEFLQGYQIGQRPFQRGQHGSGAGQDEYDVQFQRPSQTYNF